ncbi:MAG: hypothetical protein IJ087_13490 [Eggerthellaceae bacterium]|nr:hypothetical protein [Eggerthellaceae bacterium]
MLQKGARFALALVLSLALCPAAAFAVDGSQSWDSGYAATQAGSGPVIISAEADSSDTITVVGSGFGATQGTSSAYVISGAIVGGEVIASAVTSWSDTEVVLEVADDLSGTIDVSITTDAGTSHMGVFIDEGPDVYEDRDMLKPYDEFATDYRGALSSSSIMKGWGRYLYYLRETPVTTGSSDFSFYTFERYGIDTGEWETLDNLPERLTYVSGCVWEGNFLVAGVSDAGEETIYMYNFELAEWSDPLDSEGVPLGAGIVNANGYLKLVGGAESDWTFVDDVYDYDTGLGIGDRIASLEVPAFCPQLAVNDGQIFVYSYGNTISQYNGTGAARHLQVIFDGEAVELNGAFPDFADVEVPTGMTERSEAFGSIAAAIEGLMLVGPSSADGATDTYILDWDWESASFLPYYKRASDARLYGAAACIHDNKLYAAAASEVEPEHCVFRATELIAPAVEKGNYQEWTKGSNDMLTITYTPDFSRFYLNAPVLVDGVDRTLNDDYIVSSGSTVIDFTPEFLNGLAVGEHEVTVYFDGYEDGPGAEVAAYFTIVDSSHPSPQPTPTPTPSDEGGNSSGGISAKGYTRPAALAMTGDFMLAVPFVILGAGAIALGVYLVRRKIRNDN